MKNHYFLSKFETILTFIFFAIYLLPVCVVAQQKNTPIFSATSAKTYFDNITSKAVLNNQFKKFTVASFPVTELDNYLQKDGQADKTLQLQIDTAIFYLQLRPSKIAASNFKLTIQTPEGLTATNPVTENIFYKGFANNNVSNTVRLTVKESLVSGFIQQDGKEFFIESLSNYIKDAAANDIVFYNTADVIANGNYNCGVTERAGMLKNVAEQTSIENVEPETNVCKKLKFVFITDFSMYSFFNEDIAALQNKMLATLNNAQGAYTGLNFGADTTTDIGTDELNFEMAQLHVSTCYDCDIILGNETFNQPGTPGKAGNWLKANTDTSLPMAAIYWTRKQLYVGATIDRQIAGIALTPFSTCNSTKTALMGVMYAPNDAYLKQASAHELGHTLGCYHDNAFIPSVNGFIMNSYITTNAVAMTSFTDLPGASVYGKRYSSKMSIRNGIINLAACLEQCDNGLCEQVENLQANNFSTGDSLLLTWQGTSPVYKIRVKEKGTVNAAYIFSRNTFENKMILHGLKSCSFYTIEVQNLCDNKTSLTISTSSITARVSKLLHERTELHDVEITVEKPINFLEDSLRITVDHLVKWYGPKKLPAKIVLKDIFSDGARHRIDIYQGSGLECRSTIFYQAPYYRKDAVTLAVADFNTCAQPLAWKDSIFRTVPYIFGTYIPKWNYKKIFSSTASILIPDGTLDSSCMMYFDNNQPSTYSCQGSIGFISPEINLKDYKRAYLSFDYKQNIRATNIRQAFFTVQAYDGQSWVPIFDAAKTRTMTSLNSSTFWDTLPSRQFISLDKFTNADFKVRFIVEDSVSYNPPGGYSPIFIALDNIRVDGFHVDSNNKTQNIVIFPNPVRNEIFVKTDLPASQPTHYRITDATGKLIESKLLKNYRINVERLSSAVYFIRFYFDDNTANVTLKFIKY